MDYKALVFFAAIGNLVFVARNGLSLWDWFFLSMWVVPAAFTAWGIKQR